MRILALMILGLMVVGCGSGRKLTAEEEKIVGTYGNETTSIKWHFLSNRVMKFHLDGKQQEEAKWKIVLGEIHAKFDNGSIIVWSINIDSSITSIEKLINGKWKKVTKEKQHTYQKIK